MIKYLEIALDGNVMRGFHHSVDSEECLVMLHGYTGNCNEARRFKVISDGLEKKGIDSVRVTYLGHGDSDLEFQDLHFEFLKEQAKTIIETVKNMGYKKVHLLGYSMGGVLAMANLDIEIEKLILVSPGFGFKENLMERYYKNPNKYDDETVDIGGLKLSKKFVDSFQTVELDDLIKNFKNEVLVVIGGNDQVIKKENIYEGIKGFENKRVVEIESCDHGYSHVSYREVLLKSVLSHLS